MTEPEDFSKLTALQLVRLYRKEVTQYLAGKRDDQLFDNNYPLWVELIERLRGVVTVDILFRLQLGRMSVWGYCGDPGARVARDFNMCFDAVENCVKSFSQ